MIPPYVRVVAAEALGKYGSKEQISKAVETLGQIADPYQERLLSLDAGNECN